MNFDLRILILILCVVFLFVVVLLFWFVVVLLFWFVVVLLFLFVVALLFWFVVVLLFLFVEPIQDVWADFDDCGMGGCVVTCDLPSPQQSPCNSKELSPTPKKTKKSRENPDTLVDTSAIRSQHVSKVSHNSIYKK